jgi:hypothetical protein
MISFHPTDVGFDVRIVDTPVELPAGVITVRYLTAAGEDTTVTGGRAEVKRQLVRAGYRIRSRPPSAEARIAETARVVDSLIAEHIEHVRDRTPRSTRVIAAGPALGPVCMIEVTYWSGRTHMVGEDRIYTLPDAEARLGRIEFDVWRPIESLGECTPTPLRYAVTRPVMTGPRYEAWLGVGGMSFSLGSHANEASAIEVAVSRLRDARARLTAGVAPIRIEDGGGHLLVLSTPKDNGWDALYPHRCGERCG